MLYALEDGKLVEEKDLITFGEWFESIVNKDKWEKSYKIDEGKKFIEVESDLMSPPPGYRELKKSKKVYGMGGYHNF